MPPVREADADGAAVRGRRDPEDLLLRAENLIADYGRAEFLAGRSDATEYHRAQIVAEGLRDRLSELLRDIIYGDER